MANWSKQLFLSALLLALILMPAGCGDIEGEVSSVTVSPTSATVGINKGYSFSAIGKNSVGTIVAVSPTWSVEGPIGTISTNGFFTAGGTVGNGNVIATVSTASGGTLTGSATVTTTDTGWLAGVMKTPEGGLAQGIFVFLNEAKKYIDDTDASGKYLISDIPPGTYLAMTQANSLYQSASLEVTIGSGETVTWSTQLIYQPGITVSPTTTLPTF